MIELKKVIWEKLSTVLTVYEYPAPQDAVLPYCTFSFGVGVKDYQRDIIPLRVTLWDQNTDARGIDNLADEVDDLLDRYKHFEDKVLQASIYRTVRKEVTDPEKDILRRELQFDCKTYFGEI